MKTELIKRACDIASNSHNTLRVLAVSGAQHIPPEDLELFAKNGFSDIKGSYALIKGETMLSLQNVMNPEPDPDAIYSDDFIKVYLVINPDNTVNAYATAAEVFEPPHVVQFYNDIRAITEAELPLKVKRSMMNKIKYRGFDLMDTIAFNQNWLRDSIVNDPDIRMPKKCAECLHSAGMRNDDCLDELVRECAVRHYVPEEDIRYNTVYVGWMRKTQDGDCFVMGVDVYGSETTKSITVMFFIGDDGRIHSADITGGSGKTFFESDDYAAVTGRAKVIEIWRIQPE